jgi:hypothetical protein
MHIAIEIEIATCIELLKNRDDIIDRLVLISQEKSFLLLV